MKNASRAAVIDVARHIGVHPSDELVDAVVRHSRFGSMRAQAQRQGGEQTAAHLRVGRVGSSRALFTPALAAQFEAVVRSDGHACVASGGGGGGGQGAESGEAEAEAGAAEDLSGSEEEEEEAAEEEAPCNFKVLDMASYGTNMGAAAVAAEVAAEVAAASAPLLLRGALPRWPAAAAWGSAAAFLRLHGGLRVQVSTGTALAYHGPEEALGLAWGAEPLTLREFRRPVISRWPRPDLALTRPDLVPISSDLAPELGAPVPQGAAARHTLGRRVRLLRCGGGSERRDGAAGGAVGRRDGCTPPGAAGRFGGDAPRAATQDTPRRRRRRRGGGVAKWAASAFTTPCHRPLLRLPA